MSSICNFGERELPSEVPFPRAPEVNAIENFSDFNLFYRNYEIDVRTDAMYNPIMQRKVDILCGEYSVSQLELSIKDLEWKELTAKRGFFDAICATRFDSEHAADMAVAKERLHLILANLTVMRLAVERIKKEKGQSEIGL